MKRWFILALAAGGVGAGPANATPRELPNIVIATVAECEAALDTFWRGNHAFYCERSAAGWYIAYDSGYESTRKGPK